MSQPKINTHSIIGKLASVDLPSTQIDLTSLTACNSMQSQALGRRVFKIDQHGKSWWLKGQIKGINTLSEQSFLNELDTYQKLTILQVSFLLPFQIFKPIKIQNSTEPTLNVQVPCQGTQNIWLEQGLKVQHAAALFDQEPEQLSTDHVIQILLQSLDILNALHGVGWIHGDLKIEHFRVDQSQCYLIDFEQAHTFETKFPQISATPRYMAPELFHGEAKTVQTDIYALGIIWLQWLTQQKLSEKSYLDWAYLHCQSLKVHLPPRFLHLTIILNAMLAKHKQQRCTNIYQIKQILSDIV